jgi:hypothetical protein
MPLAGPPRCNPDSLRAISLPIHHCGSDGGEIFSSRSALGDAQLRRVERAANVPAWAHALLEERFAEIRGLHGLAAPMGQLCRLATP